VESASTFLQQGISYAYLIRQVILGSITIGSFTMYISAVTAFTGAMRDILSKLVAIRQFRPYYEAAREYFDMKTTLRLGSGELPRRQQHTLEMRDVSFRYSGQSHDVLRHINLFWKEGERLSLVGENGSGKTTIVKLLTRLYDPTQGAIYLDGVDIRTFDYDAYMGLFSVVFQDFSLFSFSLKENVSLAQSDTASDADVLSALQRSGFTVDMEKLSRGLNTSVYKQFDKTGFEPSGGEAQQIALARALYKNAPMVILDEPTSALDPKAEYRMYHSFNDLIQNKSALYISHRLASCRFCDRIIVVSHGQIIEEGRHDDLMRRDGHYAKLYAMQAGLYKDSEAK